MAEQDQNRNEPATPFKLKEAKKRGQVAKSLEINSLLVIMSFLAAIYIWGGSMAQHHLRIERMIFDQAHVINFEISHLLTWFSGIFVEVLRAFSPLILTVMLVMLASNLVQTGPVFTFFPLKPDFERINPAAGFKRVFSMRMVFEALKSIIKIALFGTVLYLVLAGLIPQMLALMDTDPRGYPPLLMDAMSSLIFKLGMAILVVALLDLAYTRWDYGKKMRMSRREMKEEIRRREGDPEIRARIRELRKEAAKRGKALRRVPEADVLITNPTHLAVALLYKRGEMLAPQVIAKGSGEFAQTMKALARKHRVPIVEDKELARRLFRQVDIEAGIPEALYPPVAQLLAWIYRVKPADGSGAEAPA